MKQNIIHGRFQQRRNHREAKVKKHTYQKGQLDVKPNLRASSRAKQEPEPSTSSDILKPSTNRKKAKCTLASTTPESKKICARARDQKLTNLTIRTQTSFLSTGIVLSVAPAQTNLDL